MFLCLLVFLLFSNFLSLDSLASYFSRFLLLSPLDSLASYFSRLLLLLPLTSLTSYFSCLLLLLSLDSLFPRIIIFLFVATALFFLTVLCYSHSVNLD